MKWISAMFALGTLWCVSIGDLKAADVVAFCRFVPERSDDFAFENDKVAFRVYGPALRDSAENNGVDAWLKRVDYPIIDKWYRLALEEGISYHKDWGEGYDPYHVGSSLGCGSLAIWQDGTLLQPNVFHEYFILENGPDRVVFELLYKYEELEVEERKRITLEKGNRLFRADSSFTRNGKPVQLELAVGLTTHEGAAEVASDSKWNTIAAWETIDDSELGTGVVLPAEQEAEFRMLEEGGRDGSHAVFLTKSSELGQITYYVGYGWSRAGEITRFDQWQDYLKGFLNGASGGALLFEEGFESGVFSLKNSGNAPEVVEVKNARAGSYVLKSQITPARENKYRTETSLNKTGMIFEVGKEYWLGMSIKLGDDFADGRDLHDQGMLMQFHYFDWLHPEVPDAQPLLLRYIGDDNIAIDNEVFAVEGTRARHMATVPAGIGEWVDWVFHYKIDDKDGIIRIWRNGELVVDWTGDNHQVDKHDGAYLKFGLYASQFKKVATMPDGASRTVYHDEIRIAGADGSYEMVAPRAR